MVNFIFKTWPENKNVYLAKASHRNWRGKVNKPEAGQRLAQAHQRVAGLRAGGRLEQARPATDRHAEVRRGSGGRRPDSGDAAEV